MGMDFDGLTGYIMATGRFFKNSKDNIIKFFGVALEAIGNIPWYVKLIIIMGLIALSIYVINYIRTHKLQIKSLVYYD